MIVAEDKYSIGSGCRIYVRLYQYLSSTLSEVSREQKQDRTVRLSILLKGRQESVRVRRWSEKISMRGSDVQCEINVFMRK